MIFALGLFQSRIAAGLSAIVVTIRSRCYGSLDPAVTGISDLAHHRHVVRWPVREPQVRLRYPSLKVALLDDCAG